MSGSFELMFVLKATVLLAAACLAVRLLVRRRPTLAAAIGNASLFGLLALPLLAAFAPRMPVVCLPAEPVSAPVSETFAPNLMPETRGDAPRIDAPVASAAPFVGAAPSTLFDRPEVTREALAVEASTIPPQEVPTISSTAVGWIIYSAIAALLLARLVLSWQSLSMLLSRTTPVEDRDWLTRFEGWKKRLGVRRDARLVHSDVATVPFAAGFRTPFVVVPQSLLDCEPSSRDSILVHELTHIARGDYASQLLLRVVQAVYWFHPLAWLLGKDLAAARERVCDAWSVQQLGNAADYTSTLVSVARRFVRRPQTALGMAMARTSRLGMRLAYIGSNSPLRRCIPVVGVRWSLVGIASVVAAVVGAVELARATTVMAAVEPPAPPTRRTDPMLNAGRGSVTIKALEAETSKPIAGATIRIFRDGERPTPYAETDADGLAQVALPKSDSLTVDVHSPGRIQQRVEQPALPLKSGAVVEVRLHKGSSSVGGRVVDESGRPVKGAMVRFGSYLNKPRKLATGIGELVCDIDAFTDADGKWVIDNLDGVPKSSHIKVVHPEYVRFGRALLDGRPPVEQLVAGTAVTVLKKGVPLEGKVVDANGAPVEGARLLADDFPFDDSPRCTTNAAGRFRFGALQPGRVQLAVVATGVGSDLVVIAGLDKPMDIDVRLAKGCTIKGSVVDDKGKALAGAGVSALFGHQSPLNLNAIADANGRFEIADAPPRTLTLYASFEGRRPFERAINPAKEPELRIVMNPTWKILGSVVDAETGKPVPQFRAAYYFTSDGAPASFAFNRAFDQTKGVDGRYSLQLRQDNLPVQVGAWADGYQLARSETFRITKTETVVNLRLKKETRPKVVGVVLTPEGKPASDALVLISTTRESMAFSNDRVVMDHLTESWRRTDKDGRFEFPPQEFPFVLAARHASGYAQGEPQSPNKSAASNELRLRGWARIEGTFLIDGKPSADQQLQFTTNHLGHPENQKAPYTYSEATTRTDRNGRFVLANVAPLPGALSRYRTAGSRGGFIHRIDSNLSPSPGETIRLNRARIRGLSVVGKFEIPDLIRKRLESLAEAGWGSGVRSDRPAYPIPADVQKGDRKTRDKWILDWIESPAGKEYRKTLKYASLQITEDGRFRLDGVEPDKYRMTVSFRTPSGEWKGRGEVLGTVDFAFEVPAKDPDSDVPIDLGVVPVKLTSQIRIGQKVPEISALQLDGSPWKLSSHRGKVVVLDYWATWCGPCIAAIPRLDALHKEFGDAVEFVSLSCDDKVETVKEFLAKRTGAGRQVFAGKEHPSMKTLGIDAYPTFLLIDASGTLRWRGHDVDDLAKQIPAARK